MKTIQRLEISSGFCTFLAMLMFIYFVDIPHSQRVKSLTNDLSGYDWWGAFIFLILPSLLIAVCSYNHAFKRDYISLGLIFLLGSVITFLCSISFLIGSALEGYVLIGVSPGILAFLTIVFGLLNLLQQNRTFLGKTR